MEANHNTHNHINSLLSASSLVYDHSEEEIKMDIANINMKAVKVEFSIMVIMLVILAITVFM
ncbi:MAG: hypothetical protein ACK5C5_02690 [Bacteroidota bacterium]|jgi:hypothetical protein